MPIVARKGAVLTIDFSDLKFTKAVPWNLLSDTDEPALELDDLRERIYEFMDVLAAQELARKRQMCMNVKNGRVCNAKSSYVVDRTVYLCEECWNDESGGSAKPVNNKIEF